MKFFDVLKIKIVIDCKNKNKIKNNIFFIRVNYLQFKEDIR